MRGGLDNKQGDEKGWFLGVFPGGIPGGTQCQFSLLVRTFLYKV